MTRKPAVLLAVLVAMLCAPALASAALLEPADATELAQTLADATEEQDVCYGWNITVSDQGGYGGGGPETGSSQGPGRPLDPSQCSRWVELVGQVVYVPQTCECSDEAEIDIRSNLKVKPTRADLSRLGLGAGDLLSEKEDDVALINMVEALPLLVAESGQAPYVPFEPSSNGAATGQPTNSPTIPDWLRSSWPTLVLSIVLIAAGLWWLAQSIAISRARTRHRPSPRTMPPTSQEDH